MRSVGEREERAQPGLVNKDNAGEDIVSVLKVLFPIRAMSGDAREA
jgi:hypothetical protein